MRFTQPSKTDFLLCTVLHSEVFKKETEKRKKPNQSMTSPFGANCIFIAAEKSKWERKSNEEFYQHAFMFLDLASDITF